MGRLKTKLANFNSETGRSTYIYTCNGKSFIGVADCHAEDMDMCSKLVGLKFAELRAYLKYAKHRKQELHQRVSTLESLVRNLSTSSDFNINSNYGKKILNSINESKEEMKGLANFIEEAPAIIKKEIEMRDKLYVAIRNRRNGIEGKTHLFTERKDTKN